MRAIHALLWLLIARQACGWTSSSFRSAENDVAATATAAMVLSAASLAQAYHIDPSDYFTGASPRPRLEILHPDNGAILDTGDVDIRIALHGYDLPSHFHDSRVCVGLSSGTWAAENCFDQSTENVFHIKGLTAGLQYALRIVFFERGNAIAVSVRNFRVAGIKGLGAHPDDAVTIQTAVQVAVHYQASGMEAQAESIYRSILREYPQHQVKPSPRAHVHDHQHYREDGHEDGHARARY
jgi:hypothetical protein